MPGKEGELSLEQVERNVLEGGFTAGVLFSDVDELDHVKLKPRKLMFPNDFHEQRVESKKLHLGRMRKATITGLLLK